ncbi:MAG: response regulator transcription factor [Acidimicrobiales bacterium]
MALQDLLLAHSTDVAGSDAGHRSIDDVQHRSEPEVPAGDGAADSLVAMPETTSGETEPLGGPLQGATTVLVVEDDETQAIAIRAGLEREGFAVSCVRDGAAGLEAFRATDPDVVIVDAMLPGLSGIDVCRRIREARSTVPVIVVSSRSEELDVVLAMEIGADDFLAKPYRMRVLVARIRAVMRRSAPRRGHLAVAPPPVVPAVVVVPLPEEVNPRVLVVDDLKLDPDRHEVYVRGERVELTRQEFRLLEELLRRAGMLLLRQTLLERIWGSDFDGNGKILSTLINRLRARIEDDPDNPVRIVTIRGLGYRYERQHQIEDVAEPHTPGSKAHRFPRDDNVDYTSLLLLSEVGTPAVESQRAWE